MAARTSAGVGVGVTITLLGVVCLTLFITTIVFLSKYQAADKKVKDNEQQNEAYVKKAERERDDILRLKDQAQRDQRKSVVGYLNDTMRATMRAVTGSSTDTLEQLNNRLAQVEGATGKSLLDVVRDRDAQIRRLSDEVKQADEARVTAQTNLTNEANRIKQLVEGHQATIAALNNDIGRYKAEVDSYRDAVNQAKIEMDRRVGELQQRADAQAAKDNDAIRRLTTENIILKDTVADLRTKSRGDILKPADEFALVDGRIVSVDPGQNQVYIGIGSKNKVILGMSFAVYSDAKAIRPDANGNYPRGKAELEVINVGADSAICRITSETKGNPVVKGDVIANAIYDPNKVYKFMVYGNFDANGDGRVTASEAEDVKAIIANWGGTSIDELAGDVDFLVLGARPILPPEPGSGDPIEVVREFQRLKDIANRYDDLLRQADSTSIPVLNQNRLFTLVGKRTGIAR